MLFILGQKNEGKTLFKTFVLMHSFTGAFFEFISDFKSSLFFENLR